MEFGGKPETKISWPPPEIFMFKKSCLRSKICNINIWVEKNPPPPHLELFRKLISFGVAIRPSYLDLGLTSQLHPGSCPFFTATSSHLSKIKVKLDKLAEDQIKIIWIGLEHDSPGLVGHLKSSLAVAPQFSGNSTLVGHFKQYTLVKLPNWQSPNVSSKQCEFSVLGLL